MCCKKNGFSTEEKYCGEDIALQDVPRQVFNDVVQFTYDVELKRQESIIAQSSNMLVFISLLSAAFCAILPSVFSLFEEQATELVVLCCCSVLIGILLLSSLIIVLVSQWRFSYVTTPDIVEVKRCLAKATNDEKKEDLSADYAERFIPEILMSLKENNNLRCNFVIASMILMLITLIVFIASVFIVLFLYWR